MLQHRARKRFGQNFLVDQGVIHAIVSAIRPHSQDNMLEIGPGLGALTKHLLHTLSTLKAVEIDRDLVVELNHHFGEQLHLTEADALTVDYSQFGPNLRVVGNLPYNISTPLLLHLLKYKTHLQDMHFMLQKEVVSRMCAKPGCKAFGRLSVMVQYYCKVEHLFDVPPSAFNPPPKVDSSVIRLTPYTDRPYPDVDTHILKQVVACAFLTRRKTLANNLKSILPRTAIESLGIDPNKRPEQLSILEYVELAKIISNQGGYFEHLVQQE